jgi:hypothetical protein
MAVPTHGPSCQTRIYPTDCWYCGAKIHVLQCTCDSVILFDKKGWPWPKHDCADHKGIGGSGLSGWTAIDVLRANGVTISSDILAKIFPSRAKQKRDATPLDIKAVRPTSTEKKISLLAVVRDLYSGTKKTAGLEAISGIGAKLLGIPKGRLSQITLIVNSQQPNLSYTCVLPEKICSPQNLPNKVVFAELEPKIAGGHAIWIVTELRII